MHVSWIIRIIFVVLSGSYEVLIHTPYMDVLTIHVQQTFCYTIDVNFCKFV